ncbi:MAG: hypothetical protein HOY69_11715 [Streptomyces sp.]|nr:hypothetical protein [Streptomyces sp.]
MSRATAAGRSRRAGRLAALLGLLGVGLTAAGCGIPTTGVVEAGEPGVGVQPATTLYFVRDQDGALVTLQRRTGSAPEATGAVMALFKGLFPTEMKMLGLRSELPAGPAEIRFDGATVSVDLGPDAPRLTATAVDQIACTAAAAQHAADPDAAGPLRITVTAGGLPQQGSPDQLALCATAPPSQPLKNAAATPSFADPPANNPEQALPGAREAAGTADRQSG